MPTTINVEPNWENMFEVSIAIVNSIQKTPKGQKDLIIEMLRYGKRLHVAKMMREKTPNKTS